MQGRGLGSGRRGTYSKGMAGASHKGSTREGCLHSRKIVVIVERDNPRVAKVFIVMIYCFKRKYLYMIKMLYKFGRHYNKTICH
jgi:hypothetical protein